MTEINPHQRALRKGRTSIARQTYLITTVTRNRAPYFSVWQVGTVAARVTIDANVMRGSRFLAWVLMPDHLHGLLQLGDDLSLSEMIKRIKGNIAVRVSQAAGIQGGIWQHGFHDHALRKEEDLQDTARYIVMNPVRAGLVKRIGDYPFWNADWLL